MTSNQEHSSIIPAFELPILSVTAGENWPPLKIEPMGSASGCKEPNMATKPPSVAEHRVY